MEYRFECQRCLYCCSKEPGYVFLSKKEIDSLASLLAVGFEEFIEIYCRKVDYGLYYMISLKEKENYDCIFLSSKGCKVYDARPLQCRTYPFWKGIADNPDAWKSEMKSCPGIGRGRLFDRKEVERIIQSNGENEPYIIFK